MAWYHGFQVDPSTLAWLVTTDATGATLLRGWLRAPDGSLVCTTDPTGATMRQGLMRSPSGALVVEASPATTTLKRGFMRNPLDALAVATSPTGSLLARGVLRDAAGAVVVNGLGAPPPADVTPPNTTITAGPAGGSTITTSTATFSFSADEAATFQVQLDGGTWTTATSPYTTPALTNASHTFAVRAIDTAGNVDATPASVTFTVNVVVADTTAPNTTITAGPAGGSTITTSTATFSFTADEPSTFQVQMDGGTWTTATSPYTTPTLTNASHTFAVRATDTAGNVDATPASVTFTVAVPAADYNSVVMADSPARFYKLDEATGLPQDSSGNAQHSTGSAFGTAATHGVASLLTSGVGKSYHFTGGNEYQVPRIDMTGSFTVTALIRANVVGGTSGQTIFGAHLADTTGQSLNLQLLTNGTIRLSYFNDDLLVPAGTFTAVHGTVYHVAFVRDNTNDTSKVYVNGTLVGSNNAGPFAPATPTSVVCSIGVRKTDTDNYEGDLDELAIYTAALSQARIQAQVAAR